MNKTMRHSGLSIQPRMHEPMRTVFDSLFDGSLFQNGLGDDSSVVTSQWAPRVDIKEVDDAFVIYADIPGVEPGSIEVQMENSLLTIKGERREEQREETDHFSRVERRHGSFHRRFALPDSADPEGISASGHNGVLEIRIPKRPETTPRRIHVGNARH